jgi:CubicO group peptidase (beta-lactamase class C family)
MTLDTIFDLASLTKVIATTPAVMQLVEQGKVRLNDPVAKYLPEFAENGKEDITVRQLLTHYSGLRARSGFKTAWEGKETAYRMAFAARPRTRRGRSFSYSDVNFIVLGALVERVSGEGLDEILRAAYLCSAEDDAHAVSASGGVAVEDRAHAV